MSPCVRNYPHVVTRSCRSLCLKTLRLATSGSQHGAGKGDAKDAFHERCCSYDLRFPELFVALRDAGAHLILIPSAFMPTTGEAHWEAGGSLREEEGDGCWQVLLRARAIETQCYVAAAAQFGRHNEKRSSYGHALIVDPWGKVKMKEAEAHHGKRTREHESCGGKRECK